MDQEIERRAGEPVQLRVRKFMQWGDLSITGKWHRIQSQLGIEFQLDPDLEYNRFYCASHPRAPIHLWLGQDDPEDPSSTWQLGYSQKTEAELLPCGLVCFIRGPTGMGRLDLATDRWLDLLTELVPAMQSWASSPDWEEKDGVEYHWVRELTRKWSSGNTLFEAGYRMELVFGETAREQLCRKARLWNGDLDRLVHDCYRILKYRTNPDHIKDFLEQKLPELI